MTVLQAPAVWPFPSPVVPAHLMPSGLAYTPNPLGQIPVQSPNDIAALFGYGFAIIATATSPGAMRPDGTTITISNDGVIGAVGGGGGSYVGGLNIVVSGGTISAAN